MAAIKTLGTIHGSAGRSLYCVVKRQSDGFFLDSDDGAFKVFGSVVTLTSALTADTNIARLYEIAESRTVWTDGEYIILFYLQSGGSPVQATDKIIAAAVAEIATDVATFRPYHTSQGSWQEEFRTITSISPTITGITVQGVPSIDSQITELTLFRGDSHTLVFVFGTEVDLTDRVVNFMAKNNLSDLDTGAVIDVGCTITDAANGEGNVVLTSTHLATVGTLFAEFESRDDVGDTNPKTLSHFKLNIVQDVRIG